MSCLIYLASVCYLLNADAVKCAVKDRAPKEVRLKDIPHFHNAIP